uniref:Uncharacterized protein n=1 Tax=Opuntia streptacantha TaxID=393608 RepID=A0A7C9CUP0_OPUST
MSSQLLCFFLGLVFLAASSQAEQLPNHGLNRRLLEQEPSPPTPRLPPIITRPPPTAATPPAPHFPGHKVHSPPPPTPRLPPIITRPPPLRPPTPRLPPIITRPPPIAATPPAPHFPGHKVHSPPPPAL